MEVYVIEIYDGQEADDPTPKSGGQIKDGCMIDTYNQQIQYDVSCTIRTNINTANHHFIAIMKEWQTIIDNKQLNPFRGSLEDISPCITSACGAGGGMIPMTTDADVETTKSKEFIEQARGHQQLQFRIRKLTPRECFRLMDVNDSDIDKIQAAGISNSQQYKMAGNSIVVACLYGIFEQLFYPRHINQGTLF